MSKNIFPHHSFFHKFYSRRLPVFINIHLHLFKFFSLHFFFCFFTHIHLSIFASVKFSGSNRSSFIVIDIQLYSHTHIKCYKRESYWHKLGTCFTRENLPKHKKTIKIAYKKFKKFIFHLCLNGTNIPKYNKKKEMNTKKDEKLKGKCNQSWKMNDSSSFPCVCVCI